MFGWLFRMVKLSTNGNNKWPTWIDHWAGWGALGVIISCIWLQLDPNDISWTEFPLDDGWIHLVYIKSIATTGLPAYNPDELQTGMSSLLWVIINVPFYWVASLLELPPAVFPKLLSGFFGGLSAGLMVQMSQKKTPFNPWGLLIGVILLLHPQWLFSSASGMEVTLTAFLWLKVLESSKKRSFWVALALICRLESLLLWGFMLLRTAQNKEGDSREKWMMVVLPVTALGLWFGLNFFISGHPLPATFAIKGQTDSLFRLDNLQSIINYGGIHIGWVVIGAIGIAIYRSFKNQEMVNHLLFLIAMLGAMSVTHTIEQPAYFYWSRYLHPLLPVAFCLFISFLKSPFKYILILVFLVNSRSIPQAHTQFVNNTSDIYRMDTLTGELLKTLSASNWVASMNAGSIRFHSERPVVDLLGLNNHELAFSENKSQTIVEQLRTKGVQHVVLFASQDAVRLVEATGMQELQVLDLGPISICDCPSQQRIGLFEMPKPQPK